MYVCCSPERLPLYYHTIPALWPRHPYVSHDFFIRSNDFRLPMPPPPPTPPRPDWPIPTFSLRIDDLSHPGIKLFFNNVDPITVMHDAAVAVLQWLYVTTVKAPKK